MSESRAASGLNDGNEPNKPTVDCRNCGDVAALVRIDPRTKYDISHYRCKGRCREGGHRVHDGEGKLVNEGGPVFEGPTRQSVEVFAGP